MKQHKVTKKQLSILRTLHRFRFGTTDLLAVSEGLKDGRYIHARLETLAKQGYLGKHYNDTYRLRGRPARYYLLPPAFAALKQSATEGNPVSRQSLKNAYKDKDASDHFMARKLAIFDIYNNLSHLYAEQLGFWAKDQLAFKSLGYFPQSKPDAFVRLILPHKRPQKRRFFLLYLDTETPLFAHMRLLRSYLQYLEADEWHDATDTALRGMLLVCESPDLLQKVRRKLARLVGEYDENPGVFYTTLPALRSITNKDQEIWQCLDKPLEVFSICDL
jgi:hypothetical protein